MTAGAVLDRATVASTVLQWSAAQARPLVVGNGFLAREVMAAGDGDQVLYLLAGMGLASAVAAGVAVAGTPTVALEGDGNHLMGLPATATIGLRGLPVTHVVHWNGGWESTGGQRFTDTGAVHDVGPALGYRWSSIARSPDELRDALAHAAATGGPVLIHAVGAMGDPPAPRSDLTMHGCADRFRRWAGASCARSGDPSAEV